MLTEKEMKKLFLLSLMTLLATAPSHAEFTVAFLIDSAICNGTPTGRFTLTDVTGGTPPYTILLDGTQIALLQPVTLSGGPHTLTIEDSAGILSTQQILIPEPSPLSATFVTTPVTCFGGATGGSITITRVTGGTAPYTLTIDGRAATIGAPFGPLASGAHTLTIVDTNGCSFSQQINVSSPAEIKGTFEVTPTQCNGVANGVITLTTATGGTPGLVIPYFYSVDGGPFTPMNTPVTGLSAGAHSVIILDGSGCQSNGQQVIIPEPAPFSIAFSTTPVTCNGSNAGGSITVSGIRGGTAPFTLTIDGASATIGVPFGPPLRAGTHDITVTDANGCTVSQQVNVSSPAEIKGTFRVTPAQCNGEANGSITLTAATGGTPGSGVPYFFSVDGGTFTPLNTPVSGLTGGVHTVIIMDGANCVSSSQQIVVPEPDPFESTTAFTAVTNNGGNDGTFTVRNVRGGTPPYEFTLDGVTFYNIGETVTDLTAGLYTLTISDENDCTASEQITIPEPLNPRITLVRTIPASTGKSDGSITIIAESNKSVEYSINSGATFQADNVFTNLPPGEYCLFVRNVVASSAQCPFVAPTRINLERGGIWNSKQKEESAEVATLTEPVVFAPPPLTGGAVGIAVVGTVAPLVVTATTTPCSITVTATGGKPPYLYSINGGPFQTSNVFTGLLDGQTYVITVLDANGHTTSIQVTIPLITDPIEQFLVRKSCANGCPPQ